MPKYAAIAEVLVKRGIVSPYGFRSPEPASADCVALSHVRSYVEQVFAAEVPEELNRLIGFHVSEAVAMRARLASAGTVLAGRLALECGIATSTAGGSHHAKRAHGAGFCVFNDVAIATSVLLAAGEIGTAMVFDCDVHQGDGTAEIFRSERRVFTVSIHAEKNFPSRKEQSDIDVGLPDGTEDKAYLDAVQQTLDVALRRMQPDIVFYNAGVDPHVNDRLGRLALSDGGLEARDRLVIGRFRDLGIPVACVMGGGYSRDIEVIAARHSIVHSVAAEFAG